MYLKYLAIKGFKSFADPVRVRFSPGLTVVVGPNGSGKSNVVDALAWVLGAQGPKQLRSSKMEDVIFAGSENRAPLGRAEVSVTFDNSDEALSLKLNEVSISRSLFRSGESSYKLNDVSCRLNELVDLLGEVGVGKSQHLIISQGEIDDIVNARPEEIRVILEEAAGITRYKKRRDVALKHLLEVDADLEQISKLERDLRRRIKPLEKQYESARLRDELIGRQRSLSLWIAKMEIDELKDRERYLREHRDTIRRVGGEKKSRYDQIRSELKELVDFDNSPELEVSTRLKERVVNLESKLASRELVISERISSLQQRVEYLARELDSARVRRIQRTKDELEAKLKREGQDLLQREQALKEISSNVVAPDVSDLGALEEEIDALRKHLLDRRSTLESQKAQQNQEASARRLLGEDLHRADARLEELAAEKKRVGGLKDEVQLQLDQVHVLIEDITKDRERIRAQRNERLEELQVVRADLASLEAEIAALRTFQGERTQSDSKKFIAESLLEFYEVPEGLEFALEAALGPLSQAIVARDEEDLRAKYQILCEEGTSGLVISREFLAELAKNRRRNTAAFPQDILLLSSSLKVRTELPVMELDVSVLLDLVGDVCVVRDYEEGAQLISQIPTLKAVTKDGHIFSKVQAEISLRGDKALAIRVAHLEARRHVKRKEVDHLERQQEEVDKHFDALAARLDKEKKEAENFRVKEQKLAREHSVLTDRLESLVQERERLHLQLEDFRSSFDEAFFQDLTDELARLSQELKDKEERVSNLRKQRNEYDVQRRRIESLKSEVRLKAIEVESDVKAMRQLDQDLKEEVEVYENMKAERDAQLATFNAEIELASSLRSRLQEFLVAVRSTLDMVSHKVDILEEKAKETMQRRRTLESEAVSLEKDLATFTVQLTEVEENLNKVVLTQQLNEESLSRYLGVTLSQVLSARPVEGVAATTAKDELARTDAKLKELGAVNPYAALELEALKDELQQVEVNFSDVKSTRRELRSLLSKLDEEMRSSFTDSFSSVNSNFGQFFQKLFPGGQGSLRIDNSVDVLQSQVDIDVVIPGKKVRRLSLLSGGERSLVGLAFLFAIFETKPTPFIVLDEVEAALDDRNLSSFIDLLNDFRTRTQMIVVTHQKRTMEIADVLVGISTTFKGSSHVIREEVSRYEEEFI